MSGLLGAVGSGVSLVCTWWSGSSSSGSSSTDSTQTKANEQPKVEEQETKKVAELNARTSKLTAAFFRKYDPTNRLSDSRKKLITPYLEYLINTPPGKREEQIERIQVIYGKNCAFLSSLVAEADLCLSNVEEDANKLENQLFLPAMAVLGVLREMIVDRKQGDARVIIPLLLNLDFDEEFTKRFEEALKKSRRAIQDLFSNNSKGCQAFLDFLREKGYIKNEHQNIKLIDNFYDLFSNGDDNWSQYIQTLAALELFKKFERDLTPALNVIKEAIRNSDDIPTNKDKFRLFVLTLSENESLMKQFKEDSKSNEKCLDFYKEIGILNKDDDSGKIFMDVLFRELMLRSDWFEFIYSMVDVNHLLEQKAKEKQAESKGAAESKDGASKSGPQETSTTTTTAS